MNTADHELIKTDFGAFFVSPIYDPVIYYHLKEFGGQQKGDLQIILLLLEQMENKVLYDIGAHIGTMSVPVALHLREKGRVFAFEGSTDTFEVLKKNVEINDLEAKIACRNAVVTNDTEERYSMSRSSSNRGRTQFKAFNGTIKPVSIDTLENELLPPGLIKIDVEGMEPQVIWGAEKCIQTHRPVIFFETNAGTNQLSGVWRFIKKLGYRFFANTGQRNATHPRIELSELNPFWDGSNSYQDIFAIPREIKPRNMVYHTSWGSKSLKRGIRKLADKTLRRKVSFN